MTPSELQEKLLVQFLPTGSLPGGQEDVAADVLVNDAAAGRHTAEGHIDVLVKFNGHLRGGPGRGAAWRQRAKAARPLSPPSLWARTCRMSQLTFHCRMLLKRQVLTTSPTARSIRIRRLLAMPRISSFLLPLNLVPRGRQSISKDCTLHGPMGSN